MGFFEVAAATGPEVRVPAADFTIEVGEFYFKIEGAVAGEATVGTPTSANRATRS
ncbi:MAG TPA: hypothetical protein VGS09_00410 [Actinomycetota bacterium]|nr:hypothetical protein [Actinomycetota bacterium]